MGDQEAVIWDTSWDEEWAREVASWKWIKVGRSWKMSGTCRRCSHEMGREIEMRRTTKRGQV